MIDQRFMQSLADDMKDPMLGEETAPEMLLAAGPARTDAPQAFVGTRLNVPKAGQAQPTTQDRERLAVGLLDSLAGALRGAAAQTIGLPGDIRSIIDMINQEGAEKYLGQRTLPTTEEILQSNMLPPVLKEGVPRREERQPSVETAEQVGTFLPAPGIPEAVKMAGRAIKATKGMPIGMSIQVIDGSDIPVKKAPKIETPQFKNWFGNSKVIDEQGKPLVMFHGSSSDVEQFKHNFMYSGEGGSQSGSGFYFTTSPSSASMYSQKKGIDGANVMPVYLSLKNPLKIDFAKGEVSGADLTLTKEQVRKIIMSAPNIKNKNESPLLNFGDINYEGFNKVLNDAIDAYAGGNNLAALRNDFFGDDHEKWLRSLSKATGYDSAYSVTPNGDIHYIAWFPEQIKSAIGNVGTFNPKDPSTIRGVAVGGGGGAVATQEENQ